MDIQEKKKIYNEFLQRKRKRNVALLLILPLNLVILFFVLELGFGVFINGAPGSFSVISIIIGFPIVFYLFYLIYKRIIDVNSNDIDPFIIAEMKGKLKSKGINLNIDKKDTNLNESSLESNTNSNIEELDKLFNLYNKGAISDEEYQKLKEKVLSKN